MIITNPMEHSPSWESNSSLATQDKPGILWTLGVQPRIYKSLSLIVILTQIYPAQAPLLFFEDPFQYYPSTHV